MKDIEIKFERYGSDSLSDKELISLITGSSTASEKIHEVFGNIHNFGRDHYHSIGYRAGIESDQAKRIDLCLEFSRRYEGKYNTSEISITEPEAAADYLYPILGNLEVEKFVILFLNSQKVIQSILILSSGTATATLVDVKLVTKEVIVRGANSIIIAHNHPSGTMRPSSADLGITKRIIKALELFETVVDDHIIIGNQQYLSFRSEGYM